MNADAAPAPDDPLVLRLRPELAAISPASDAADAHAAAHGAGERPRYALRLVLEELLANVALHSGASGEIEVVVGASGPAIAVRVTDDGRAFDPTSAADPSPPASIEEASVGGLGLSMVRNAARRMSWRRDGGRNVVDVEIAVDDADRKRGANGVA